MPGLDDCERQAQLDDSALPGFEHDMVHHVNGAEAADDSGNPDVEAQITSMASS